MKRFVSLLAFVLASLSVSAYVYFPDYFPDGYIYSTNSKYDFSVNGIYYSITSKEDRTVSVSYSQYQIFQTKNGNIIRKLIPCKRNSDNMVGMYDTINNVFYYPPNCSSYQLIAGPNV